MLLIVTNTKNGEVQAVYSVSDDDVQTMRDTIDLTLGPDMKITGHDEDTTIVLQLQGDL